MKIRSHSESHLVELEDGSQWQIFPGDLDQTLKWEPETNLTPVPIDDEISSFSLVSTSDGSRARVIPEGEKWPAKAAKAALKKGELPTDAAAGVAIDGSKFKAVNNQDKNFTKAKVQRRRAQLEESVARYLSQLDTADRQEPTEALVAKITRLKEKLTKLKEEMGKLALSLRNSSAGRDLR